MKIVHICRKFLEGFAYQDNELVDMQSSTGHQVTVITSASDDSSLYFDMSLIKKQSVSEKSGKPLNYGIIRLPLKNKVNFRLWKFKFLYETLSKIAPDLIFFHGAPFLSLPEIARYKKNNPNVKLFMDCHTDHNNAGRNILSRVILHKIIYRNIIRKTRNQVDIYYYLAPNIKKFMKEMYLIDDDKLKFLPRGGVLEHIDFENAETIRFTIREKLNIPQNATVIVTGGKLDYTKMTHKLAEAVNRLQYNNVHLLIFGMTEKIYEQELHSAINNNPKIHLIGWIDAKDVYNYFLASDIACFPGRHSVLWEQSICCGLPLIIKDWYKGMHYLNVNNNVLMIEDSDTEYIEQALTKLIENPELCSQMRKNAETEGSQFFSYRRISESIISDALL